jgi:tRNA/tmRNA/rRNA uracil-C5-methylase (TrmA/RlmC/RlmD family)
VASDDIGASVSQGLQLTATAMVAGGDALAREESARVVFVEGALPGETVLVDLVDSRADFARAVVTEVLEASPDRLPPPCPAVAAGCGGCTWQHIAAAAQIRFKVGIVRDSLRRIGHMRTPPEPVIIPMAARSQRTTARLAVSPEGRSGYRPRGRPGVAVETDWCHAAHPRLEQLITEGCFPGAHEVLLRVAVASGERVARVVPGSSVPGVSVPSDVVVVGPGGSAPVTETVAGRQLRISIDSFFQPGPVAAEALVAAVAEAAGTPPDAGGQLVDAYAGVGLFASALGDRWNVPVTAIESNPSAVADARVNLAALDAVVVAADVARWRPRRRDPRVEVMVADPPRPGLGRPGVAAVVASRTPRLVLVSCDPASLGRDTALLQRAGYQLASVALVDAFPDTFHLEVVSRFDAAPGA